MKRYFLICSALGLAMAFALTPITASTLVAQDDAAVQDDEKKSADELMDEARSLQQQADWPGAAKAFQKVVEVDADNGEAWHLLGYSLHMNGKLDEAMKAHKKAATFERFAVLGNYNMACAYSLKKDADNAFKYLDKSIEAGFRDLGQIDGDGDFDNVRDDARYGKAIAKMKNDGEEPEEMKEKPAKDKKSTSFVGHWKVVSGLNGGEEVGEEIRAATISFTKDEITIPSPEGVFVFSYEVDADKKPIQIDMKMEEGPQVGSTALGIIKVDGEKVTLCYHPMGGDRPEAFKSTEDDQFHMMVMEKTKKKIAADSLVGDWKYVSGLNGGAEVGQEMLASNFTADKDKFSLPAGPEKFEMSYKIDPSKSPAHIDMTILSGPGVEEGTPALGIIKFDGEKVVLCYDPMSGKRPEKFESTDENKFHLFEFKKVIVD